MRRLWPLLGLALASSCFSLNPFLFTPIKVSEYHFPDDEAASRRELFSFQNDGGLTLWGLWMDGKRDAATPHCKRTIVYCHGNGDNLEHFYDRVKLLSDMGYDVLLFDYRGYGASEGEPTELGLYEDARAALREAVARRPKQPFVFYGYSLGAAVCTHLATEVTPFALHLDAPFASIDRMVKDDSDLPLNAGHVSDWRFDNLAAMDKLRCPLEIFHGDADDYVDPAWGKALFDEAHDPKRFWSVPGADHGTIPFENGGVRAEYAARLTEFLDQPDPDVTPFCK